MVRNIVSSTQIVGGTSINASAVLQADSTTQGFLPPRMTAAQRTAIASPETGLIVSVSYTHLTLPTKRIV